MSGGASSALMGYYRAQGGPLFQSNSSNDTRMVSPMHGSMRALTTQSIDSSNPVRAQFAETRTVNNAAREVVQAAIHANEELRKRDAKRFSLSETEDT